MIVVPKLFALFGLENVRVGLENVPVWLENVPVGLENVPVLIFVSSTVVVCVVFLQFLRTEIE